MNKNKTDEQYLIVITEFKEIFAGYSKSDPKADIIELTKARQVVYYSAETKGLLGLAAIGPAKDSRLSNEAPSIIIRKPVNVMIASPAAIDRFSAIIWK